MGCVPTGPENGPECMLVHRVYPNGIACDGDYFCEQCLQDKPVSYPYCTKIGCSVFGKPPVGDFCRNVYRIYPNGKACDQDYFCEYCADDELQQG